MAQRFETDGGTAFVGPLQIVDEDGEILASIEGAAAAVAVLTDSSGGTASNTIAAISDPPTQAQVRNALASLTAKVNAIIAALGLDDL